MKLDKVFIVDVESERVRELLSSAKMAQADVNSLYQAVKEPPSVRKLFLVSFQIPNLSQYRHQLQLLLIPRGRLVLDDLPSRPLDDLETRQHSWLKLCVDFDKEPKKPSRHPTLQTTSYFEPIRRLRSSIGFPADKQGRSVKFHHIPARSDHKAAATDSSRTTALKARKRLKTGCLSKFSQG